MLDDHGPGHAPPRVTHEIFQQAEFLYGQVDPAARSLNPTLDSVELQIIHRKHRFRGQVTAPHQGAYACRQFGKGKRFAQAVVGTQIQTLYPVSHTVVPREHEDRRDHGKVQPRIRDERALGASLSGRR